jgi:hypothetical protein
MATDRATITPIAAVAAAPSQRGRRPPLKLRPLDLSSGAFIAKVARVPIFWILPILPPIVQGRTQFYARKENPAMKRVLFGLFALASLSLATGCSTVGNCGSGCGDGCGSGGCGPGGCGPGGGGGLLGHHGGGHDELDPCHPRLRPLKRHKGRHGGYDAGAYGPPTAAVAYPYYTTRGPRDFFEPNPPSIGY